MNFDITLLFQIINTLGLLFLIVAIPYLIYKSIIKNNHLKERITKLENDITELKDKPY